MGGRGRVRAEAFIGTVIGRVEPHTEAGNDV